MKNRPNRILPCMCICLSLALSVVLGACSGGGGSQSPSPEMSPSPGATATVKPEITPGGANAPGAVTDAQSSQQPEQTPSPMVEESIAIRSKVEKLKGVEDLAVVVTDTHKALVVVVLASGTTMDDVLKNQITAAASKNTQVRVSSDPGLLPDVRTLEEQMYETGAMPMNQVQSIWEKIQ